MPNEALIGDLTNSIFSNDPDNQLLTQLNSGNLNIVAKNVIALTTAFNIQSDTSSSSSSSSASTADDDLVNNQLASLRQFMVEKISNLSVSDISSVKLIAAALSASTASPQQVSSSVAVNLFIFD